MVIQHELLVTDVHIKRCKRKRCNIDRLRVEWRNLTEDNVVKPFEKIKAEGPWEQEGDACDVVSGNQSVTWMSLFEISETL